jgi:cation diffusion facilitator family transporter
MDSSRRRTTPPLTALPPAANPAPTTHAFSLYNLPPSGPHAFAIAADLERQRGNG